MSKVSKIVQSRPLCIKKVQDELLQVLCEKGGRIFIVADEGAAGNFVACQAVVPVRCPTWEKQHLRKILGHIDALQIANDFREMV